MWLQSPFIRSMLLIAVVCLGLFVWWDRRRENPNPILNLRLPGEEKALAWGLWLTLIFGALLAGPVRAALVHSRDSRLRRNPDLFLLQCRCDLNLRGAHLRSEVRNKAHKPPIAALSQAVAAETSLICPVCPGEPIKR
jgi:hypothetical protein